MKVFIPTRGRVDSQRTAEAVAAAGYTPTLVCSTSDECNYEGLYGGEYSIRRVPAEGIRATRQYILLLAAGEKHVQMDDDLRFYAREPTGKFRKAEQDEIAAMMEWLESSLDRYAHAGVVEWFMCNTRPRGEIHNTRYVHVLGYNPKLFPVPEPHFRLETHEDQDFNLQLLTAGCPSVISCEWTHNETPWSSGGCNSWRTEQLHDKQTEKFRYLWPNLIKLNKKGNPVISWKKAGEFTR